MAEANFFIDLPLSVLSTCRSMEETDTITLKGTSRGTAHDGTLAGQEDQLDKDVWMKVTKTECTLKLALYAGCTYNKMVGETWTCYVSLDSRTSTVHVDESNLLIAEDRSEQTSMPNQIVLCEVPGTNSTILNKESKPRKFPISRQCSTNHVTETLKHNEAEKQTKIGTEANNFGGNKVHKDQSRVEQKAKTRTLINEIDTSLMNSLPNATSPVTRCSVSRIPKTRRQKCKKEPRVEPNLSDPRTSEPQTVTSDRSAIQRGERDTVQELFDDTHVKTSSDLQERNRKKCRRRKVFTQKKRRRSMSSVGILPDRGPEEHNYSAQDDKRHPESQTPLAGDRMDDDFSEWGPTDKKIKKRKSPMSQKRQLRKPTTSMEGNNATEMVSKYVHRVKTDRSFNRALYKLNTSVAIEMKLTEDEIGQVQYCIICGDQSKSQWNLLVHLKRFHVLTANVYYDLLNEEPGERTKKLDQLRSLDAEPVKKHSPKMASKLPCSYCKKPFLGIRNMRRHLMLVHRSEGNINETLAFFKKEFAKLIHKNRMIAIRKENLTTNQYPCRYCGLKLSMSCTRSRHEMYSCDKNPEKKKRVHCNYCGSGFKNQQAMEKHMVKHAQHDYKYVCDLCGKVCKTKPAMYEHKLKDHSGKPPRFPCSKCEKAFHYKDQLRKHVATHTKVRDVMCELCGKLFKSKGDVQKHTKHVHNDNYTYRCHICGHGMAKLSYMKNHKCGRVRRHQSGVTAVSGSTSGNLPEQQTGDKKLDDKTVTAQYGHSQGVSTALYSAGKNFGVPSTALLVSTPNIATQSPGITSTTFAGTAIVENQQSLVQSDAKLALRSLLTAKGVENNNTTTPLPQGAASVTDGCFNSSTSPFLSVPFVVPNTDHISYSMGTSRANYPPINTPCLTPQSTGQVPVSGYLNVLPPPIRPVAPVEPLQPAGITHGPFQGTLGTVNLVDQNIHQVNIQRAPLGKQQVNLPHHDNQRSLGTPGGYMTRIIVVTTPQGVQIVQSHERAMVSMVRTDTAPQTVQSVPSSQLYTQSLIRPGMTSVQLGPLMTAVSNGQRTETTNEEMNVQLAPSMTGSVPRTESPTIGMHNVQLAPSMTGPVPRIETPTIGMHNVQLAPSMTGSVPRTETTTRGIQNVQLAPSMTGYVLRTDTTTQGMDAQRIPSTHKV